MKRALVAVAKSLLTVRRGVLRWMYSRIATLTVGSCLEPPTVNGPTRLTSTTHLGRNTHFNGMTITGRGMVRIGDNFHSGPECLVITETHNYEGTALPYDTTYLVKDIDIEDNVWLGSRVIVLGGVRLGEGCIVQAGSVVVSDVPRCAIAGGSPARVFKHRDLSRYEALKAERKFH